MTLQINIGANPGGLRDGTLNRQSWDRVNQNFAGNAIARAHTYAGATAGAKIRAAVNAMTNGGVIDCRGFDPSTFMLLDVNMFADVALTFRKPLLFRWGPHDVRIKVTQSLRSHVHHHLEGTKFNTRDENGAAVAAKTMFLYDSGTVGLANVTTTKGSATITIPNGGNQAAIEVGSPLSIFGFVPPLGNDRTTINVGGGIDASTTTITVVSTTGFPTTGFLRIEDEVIQYTGVTATTFTGCTRGYQGTAAAHANGLNVDRCVYQPFYVKAISGTSYTLDGPIDFASTNCNVRIGAYDISFDGVGELDGAYTQGSDDTFNPFGIEVIGGRRVYVGPAIDFHDIDHGAVSLKQCLDSNLDIGTTRRIGHPTLGLGSDIWVFGWNKRIRVRVQEVTESNFGVFVDDRTTTAQLGDGPPEDTTVEVDHVIGNGVSDRCIGFAGGQRASLLLRNATNMSAGSNGIFLETTQWINNVAGDDIVAEVQSFEPAGVAINVDTDYAEKRVTLILPKGSGASRSYSVPEPTSTTGVLVMRPSRMVGVTYGTTVTPDYRHGDRQLVVVTDNVAFTIAAPLNPFNGGPLTVEIYNNSGGAMGAVTWNSQFKLAGAFTNPANGQRRSITFHRQGGAWREIGRTTGDVPN